MTSASWATMLVVIVNAIFFHAMPRLSRPDILFAVTVPEAFVAGAGRTLVSRYRAMVLLACFCGLRWGELAALHCCDIDTDAGSGRRRYWIYGADPGYHDEAGTDLAAIAEGHISVTPVHFDLTDVEGIDALAAHDLTRLLAPAARELR